MFENNQQLRITYSAGLDGHRVTQVRDQHLSTLTAVYPQEGIIDRVSVTLPYANTPNIPLDLNYAIEGYDGILSQVEGGNPCWRCMNSGYFKPSRGYEEEDHPPSFVLPWNIDLFPFTEPTIIASPSGSTDIYSQQGIVFAAVCFDMRSRKATVVAAETYLTEDGGVRWNPSPYLLPTRVDLNAPESKHPLRVLPGYDRSFESKYEGTLYTHK